MKFCRDIFFHFVYVCIALASLDADAQTINGQTGKLRDDGTLNYFNLVTGKLQHPHSDSLYGLEKVCINIRHEYDDDLAVYLVSPDGTTIELSTHNGFDGENYTNTCFSQDALSFIPDAFPPFTGTFHPEGFLSDFNKGQSAEGTWKLLIHDNVPGDKSGEVLDWSITFSSNPAKAFRYNPSSSLPLLYINSKRQLISDSIKINAVLGVLTDDESKRKFIQKNESGSEIKIKIKIHGQSSRYFPKKPFSVSISDTSDLPEFSSFVKLKNKSEWVFTPMYNDKSLLRNALAYNIFKKMGHYSVQINYAEVVLNQNYMGLYAVSEKIGRGKNKVAIEKLTAADTSNDKISGGYIFKIDWNIGSDRQCLYSNYPSGTFGDRVYYQTVYPHKNKITKKQNDYLMHYLDSFEIALKNKNFMYPGKKSYRDYIDINSFIDYMILTEFSKNIDGYSTSAYFHKKRNKVVENGPVWDFDIAFGNADFENAWKTEGWQWDFPGDDRRILPFWWKRFLQDSIYTSMLKNRYTELRKNVLSLPQLFFFIDSTSLSFSNERKTNFELWHTIGAKLWPNPDPIPQSYEEEILALKSWIKKRLEWMDANLPRISELKK